MADVDTADTMTLTIQLSASAGTISGGGFALVMVASTDTTGLSAAAANTALDNAVFTPASNTGPSLALSAPHSVTTTDSQSRGRQLHQRRVDNPRINGADAERRSEIPPA
ncbi:MAG: hypothetical protein R2856_08030 [Caldilineaceae bacterium]